MTDRKPGGGQDVEISIVVPVYNSLPELSRCLESLRRARETCDRPSELILVDNGSTDGSYELLQRCSGESVHIVRIEDVPVAGVRNAGARRARGEYLSFIDSDCVVEPSYFDRAVRALESAVASATGSRVTPPPNPSWVEAAWYELHRPTRDGPVHDMNSANFFVRRKVFESVGGFDESLLTGEDSELCRRLAAAGHTIYQDASVKAVHLRNPKTLPDFFRQHAWHGLGMLATSDRRALDRVVIMTALHVLFSTWGVIWAFGGGGAAVSAVGILVLSWLVAPVSTVAYRLRGRRRARRWAAAGTVLYWLYYWSRATGLLRSIGGSVLSRRRDWGHGRGRTELLEVDVGKP